MAPTTFGVCSGVITQKAFIQTINPSHGPSWSSRLWEQRALPSGSLVMRKRETRKRTKIRETGRHLAIQLSCGPKVQPFYQPSTKEIARSPTGWVTSTPQHEKACKAGHSVRDTQ